MRKSAVRGMAPYLPYREAMAQAMAVAVEADEQEGGDGAGDSTPQAPALPGYTEVQMAENLPNWQAAIDSGRATPGRIHEMESYHGMLACVIAGAGLALIPRSMLESMPGHQQVSAWPLAEEWRWLTTWLVWRRGAKTRQLEAFIALLNEDRQAAVSP